MSGDTEIARLTRELAEARVETQKLERKYVAAIQLCSQHYAARDKLRDEVIARERDIAALRAERLTLAKAVWENSVDGYGDALDLAERIVAESTGPANREGGSDNG